ncbi:peroxiredoxin [Sphaerimonospora thailandensis]|uniref:Alkyl hydroperoxide reductase E n=1 Tax=Sphaerimonospora thailandensis TaxID=795644 RepID=A0A8J3RBK0_9ACTN|nr:peroxiredoxin [Sphaerimonospora thailandensis]GIH71669.1 peroxiredoxin [Sphaerimonospora thailandensis]
MAVEAVEAMEAARIGRPAPGFELKDQHGTPVRLADHRGRKVVLVFYPLAFSRVCHGELSAIRDEFVPSAPEDVQVLAVSVDSMFGQRAWSDQEGFTFPMLADFWPHGEVARAYGVFDEEKGVALRGTFIIDGEGVVRWKVVNEIGSARDVDEYRKALAQL